MNVIENQLTKGPSLEEGLRNYFLRNGYYVVRGVPFIYQGFDVTDIDIWLYSRSSSVSREITIVDSKHKKTPQAIERIFWIKGLKLASNASNCIVATTDKRQEVKDFGKQLGVVVLDGSFLQKIMKSENNNLERISDEEFFNKINSYSLSKLDGDWKSKILRSKSLLAIPINFDSCNRWLANGKFFAEKILIKELHNEIAQRCLYLICSYLAIGIDYCLRELAFLDQNEREKILTDGFTYGGKGNEDNKQAINLALKLVSQFGEEGKRISYNMRGSLDQQIKNLNTKILGEYFSKNEVSKSLFSIAKEFEQLSMNKDFKSLMFSTVELKSLVFCLLDFWGIDRRKFVDKINYVNK